MKGFSLTEEEIDELRVAHKSSASKKDSYKINTIVLLGSCWSLDEVSEALLLDDETLRSYVNDYRSGGLPTLLKTNYKGSQKKYKGMKGKKRKEKETRGTSKEIKGN